MVSLRASLLRPTSTNLEPSLEKRIADARPIPEDAPDDFFEKLNFD